MGRPCRGAARGSKPILRETFGFHPLTVDDALEEAHVPKVDEPLPLTGWSVTVRLTVKTKPGKHWEVAPGLRRQILAACEQEGITLPYPRQEVWMRGQAPDHPESGNERG